MIQMHSDSIQIQIRFDSIPFFKMLKNTILKKDTHKKRGFSTTTTQPFLTQHPTRIGQLRLLNLASLQIKCLRSSKKNHKHIPNFLIISLFFFSFLS